MNANFCNNCNRQLAPDEVSCPTCLTPVSEFTIDADQTARRTQAATPTMAMTSAPQVNPAEDFAVNDQVRTITKMYQPSFKVGIIGFNNDAYELLPVQPAVPGIKVPALTPKGGTNCIAALDLSESTAQVNYLDPWVVFICTDGQVNGGAGLLGNAEKATIERCFQLVEQGVGVGAIGIDGGTSNYNLKTLQAMSSHPGLVAEADASNLVQKLTHLTQRSTQGMHTTSGNTTPGVIFCIDESWSMSEGNKAEAAQRALQAAVDFLAGA